MSKFEQEPQTTVEQMIVGFEQYATEIYQSNAAKGYLDSLMRNKSQLSPEILRRLIAACDKGIETNPPQSKEQRMFREFKEDLATLLRKTQQ